MTAAAIFSLALVAVALAGQDDDILSSVSFKAPFKTFDSMGRREVGNYAFGGNAEVNEYFLRLTTDRASKRGWVWAKSALDADQWSATLRFRVSGQGKKLFGDGFALWFTTNRAHMDGSLHGFTDKFTGFGIVFDTFRNTESSRVHRDVALVVGNGEKEAPINDVVGCDGDFRYWEGRDDFSVQNKSVARISFNNGRVTVALDAKNRGEFITCFQDVDLGLPAGWHKAGYFGVTASTGQLADNHDVLSLLVSTLPDKLSSESIGEDDPSLSTGNPQLDEAVRASVAIQSKRLIEKINHLNHHLEHQLSAIQDSIQSNLKKLGENENKNTERLADMEKRLAERLQSTLPQQVDSALGTSLELRLDKVEDVIRDRFDARIASELEPRLENSVRSKVGGLASAWLLPFLLLSAVVGGLSFFAYKKYKNLLKTHLL